MTVCSMTGFGRGVSEREGRCWTAEIRCVNNRFLDVKLKLPKGYLPLEDRIRKLVSEHHQRGRVDLVLTVSGDFSDLVQLKVNKDLALRYKNIIAELAENLDVDEALSATQLVSYPDVVVREQNDEDLEAVWPHLQEALEEMFQSCTEMRRREGSALAGDLKSRLAFFTETVSAIENSVPELVAQREKSLRERLEKLLGGVEMDPARLAQEVALLADKTDVTEEIVRLRCHIRQFSSFLESGEAVGRKLDFLIQEFLREVNTMASKINDAEVAHLTVDLKSELEKMREQVQNIE